MMNAPDSGEVAVLISVDTEEDNWVPSRTDIRTANIRRLPRLNAFFERLAVRPTYFVANSVVIDRESSAIVAELAQCGFVEVAAHLHPWNTPPLDEEFLPRHTMLSNLPASLQRAKLERLTAALEECLGGRRPRSFRAGRWAINSETVGALLECGYTADSSVTPYTSWAKHDDGASYLGAPTNAYPLDIGADVRRPVVAGRLIEVPPSFGFNRTPLDFWGRVHRVLSSGAAHSLLLDRIASSTGLLRHVSLSPETDIVVDMLDLTRALLAAGSRHLHLYFHSPSLLPGLTPFVRSSADLQRFFDTIEEYLDRVTALTRVRFATVSEVADEAARHWGLSIHEETVRQPESESPRRQLSTGREIRPTL